MSLPQKQTSPLSWCGSSQHLRDHFIARSRRQERRHRNMPQRIINTMPLSLPFELPLPLLLLLLQLLLLPLLQHKASSFRCSFRRRLCFLAWGARAILQGGGLTLGTVRSNSASALQLRILFARKPQLRRRLQPIGYAATATTARTMSVRLTLMLRQKTTKKIHSSRTGSMF